MADARKMGLVGARFQFPFRLQSSPIQSNPMQSHPILERMNNSRQLRSMDRNIWCVCVCVCVSGSLNEIATYLKRRSRFVMDVHSLGRRCWRRRRPFDFPTSCSLSLSLSLCLSFFLILSANEFMSVVFDWNSGWLTRSGRAEGEERW